MPDGEFFTGPIEDSVEGEVSFHLPAVIGGREVSGVRLRFEAGKVVDATAERGEEYLINLLDTDEGARRLGELGIGTNYGIDRGTRDVLLDEKIGGTVHLAVGASYPESGGTNESAVHTDMVCDLRQRRPDRGRRRAAPGGRRVRRLTVRRFAGRATVVLTAAGLWELVESRDGSCDARCDRAACIAVRALAWPAVRRRRPRHLREPRRSAPAPGSACSASSAPTSGSSRRRRRRALGGESAAAAPSEGAQLGAADDTSGDFHSANFRKLGRSRSRSATASSRRAPTSPSRATC